MAGDAHPGLLIPFDPARSRNSAHGHARPEIPARARPRAPPARCRPLSLSCRLVASAAVHPCRPREVSGLSDLRPACRRPGGRPREVSGLSDLRPACRRLGRGPSRRMLVPPPCSGRPRGSMATYLPAMALALCLLLPSPRPLPSNRCAPSGYATAARASSAPCAASSGRADSKMALSLAGSRQARAACRAQIAKP